MRTPPIRVLTFLESTTVTGPAKNLIEFATRAREAASGERPVLFEAAAWLRAGAGQTNEYIQALEKAGIPVYRLSEKHVGDPGALRRMAAIIDAVQPDLIQTHNCKSHLYVRLSGRWRRIPWVGFHHGYTTTSAKTRLYNQFDRFSLRRAWRMVTVCQPFLRQLTSIGVDPRKISVIHNSVRRFERPEAAVVEDVRRRFGIRDDSPVVLTVGRLSHEKAHQHLMTAFARLAGAAQLVLVGDGPERPRLARQAAELGLEGRVVFCGQQSDVRPFYAMASVFALPSLSEGSPNALLEAMAAGVPSVATTVGGVPEIARDRETALLVGAADPEALARALHLLLTSPREARMLADRAARHVLENFSPEAQTRALREVYASVFEFSHVSSRTAPATGGAPSSVASQQ